MSKIFISFFLLLLAACAQIVAPEGGSKDLLPPKLISATPKTLSCNYNSNKIVFTFNEMIELKNANKEIIISPEIGFRPLFSTKKRKLEIRLLSDSLKKNTTYCISFGNCLQDITEGNILKNFYYSFSTGSDLDSISLAGTVFLIKKNTLVKGASVQLKNLINGLKYNCITDEFGNWRINNLAVSKYDLTIFIDNNNDKKLNYKESYFYKKFQLNDTNIKTISYLINNNKNNSQATKVIKTQYLNNHSIGVVFNTSLSNISTIKYSLNSDLNKNALALYKTNQPDSFILYHAKQNSDTINLIIQSDTLQKFLILQPKKRIIEPLLLFPEIPIIRNGDSAIIKSTIPISLINSNEIIINGTNKGFKLRSIYPYQLSICCLNNPINTIILNPGAITNIDGDNNKGDTIIIKVASSAETGNFEFMIKDTSNHSSAFLIVKIMNQTNSFTIKTTLNKINKIKGLLPGSYSLEIWQDANENEKWDEGNYFINENPEKIIYLKDFLIIKPNWDIKDVEIYMN